MERTLCDEAAYPPPLLAVAGYRLPRSDRAFPDRPLDDQAWDVLLGAARHHRMTGLLMATVTDGAMPATRSQAQAARGAHRAVHLHVMALERELTRVAELLTGAGIDSRVLKGCAVARLDYSVPTLRSFVDVDVLVRDTDIDRAVAVLAAQGFRRTLAEPRPGFDRRFDKGMTLIPPGALYELDLHRTFVLGPWGALMKPRELWDEGEAYTVGGTTLRALSRPNRFLHSCFHMALGDWPLRLGSIRDVAEMLDGAEEDADVVLRTARSWSAEAVVAAAVSDTRRLLGIREGGYLAEWADRRILTRRELTWLALYNSTNKTFTAQAVATVRVLPRWRDKTAYLRALVLPDARYVDGRHSSAAARFRYAVREAIKGGPGANLRHHRPR
jgi:hypothetical protein